MSSAVRSPEPTVSLSSSSISGLCLYSQSCLRSCSNLKLQPWHSKPELPEPDEIVAEQTDPRELPDNPVDRPWISKDAYFRAQYQLLRCEATEGLRYSVGNYHK